MNRSLSEIIDRTRQYAMQKLELAAITFGTYNFRDVDFFNEIENGQKFNSHKQVAEYFIERSSPKIYLTHSELLDVAQLTSERFPDIANAAIKRARQITNRKILLFGKYELHYSDQVPNWHYDSFTNNILPQIHWSRIELTNSFSQGNKKFVWELNRHQYLLILGQAYLLTRERVFADVFLKHLSDWLTNNPPKIGVNWSSSLEISFRSLSWIWLTNYFQDVLATHPDIYLEMLKTLFLNGTHIERYLSTYHSPNTHLTGEALALYAIGSFFYESDKARRWADLGYRVLLDALTFQVLNDGGYCEQSTHYHRYTVDFYTDLLLIRQRQNLPNDDVLFSKLRKLYDFLLFTTLPNGHTPLIGDDDGGQHYDFDFRELSDFRPTISVGAVIFKSPELKFIARQVTGRLIWLLGRTGVEQFEALETHEPQIKTQYFPSAGYLTTRNGWTTDSCFLLIDCGKHGFLNGGHAHADALSFVFSDGEDAIFIDPGTYTYSADDELRNILRSQSSHNCFVIDKDEFAKPQGPFSWEYYSDGHLLEYQDSGTKLYFRGTIAADVPRKFEYERIIEFYYGCELLIQDIVSKPSQFFFSQNFILSPHLICSLNGNAILIARRDFNNEVIGTMEFSIDTDNDFTYADWAIEDFPVSPGFSQLLTTTRVSLRGKAAGKIRVTTKYKSLKHKLI